MNGEISKQGKGKLPDLFKACKVWRNGTFKYAWMWVWISLLGNMASLLPSGGNLQLRLGRNGVLCTYELRYIQLLDRYLPKRVIVHIKSTTANFNLHPITLRTIREPFFHDAPAVRASNFTIPLAACHAFLGLWHIVASRTYQGYLVSLVVGRPDLEIALDVKVPRPHRQVLRYIGFGLVPGRRLSGVTSKLRQFGTCHPMSQMLSSVHQYVYLVENPDSVKTTWTRPSKAQSRASKAMMQGIFFLFLFYFFLVFPFVVVPG